MKDIFSYPYDSGFLLRKQKSLRKEFKNDGIKRIPVKIAILGGSTADAVRDQLELFLLNYGLEPSFYLSEYGQFRQDALFPPQELVDFAPDIIYFHTTNRNIRRFPTLNDTPETAEALLEEEFGEFRALWESVRDKLGGTILQNNFELPSFRLLGNADASDPRGKVHFIGELNRKFAECAAGQKNFYVNDIHYLSACYGLDKWADGAAWNLYKYP